jgi:hypothetical protein
MTYSFVSLGTMHEVSMGLLPESEMATENDEKLPTMLSIEESEATEAPQSLEVNLSSVDDTFEHIQRELQIEEMRSRVEMRIQSILKGDPTGRFRRQVHNLRGSELGPCTTVESKSPDYVASTSDESAPFITEQSPSGLCSMCGMEFCGGLMGQWRLHCHTHFDDRDPVAVGEFGNNNESSSSTELSFSDEDEDEMYATDDEESSDTASSVTTELSFGDDNDGYEVLHETADGGNMENNKIPIVSNVASRKQIVDAGRTSDADTSPPIVKQSPKDFCRTCGTQIGDAHFRGLEVGECLHCRIFDCHPDPVEDASDRDTASSVTTELTYDQNDDADDGYNVYETVDEGNMENNEIPVTTNVASRKQIVDAGPSRDANTSPPIEEQSPNDFCKTCGTQIGDARFRGLEAGECLHCHIFDCHADPVEDASDRDTASSVTTELTYNHDDEDDGYEVYETVDVGNKENYEIPVIINIESTPGPESAGEGDKQLTDLLSTEERQSLKVNIKSVDDALQQGEQEINEKRGRVEMRLESMLKGDPLAGLRQQAHARRDCHLDPGKATSDNDAASCISELTYIEDDGDAYGDDGDDGDGGGDDDDGYDDDADDIVHLVRQSQSRTRLLTSSHSWMRRVDDDSELIIPDAARLDSIMETLINDTGSTSEPKRTPRSVARALAQGSTAIMYSLQTIW